MRKNAAACDPFHFAIGVGLVQAPNHNFWARLATHSEAASPHDWAFNYIRTGAGRTKV